MCSKVRLRHPHGVSFHCAIYGFSWFLHALNSSRTRIWLVGDYAYVNTIQKEKYSDLSN